MKQVKFISSLGVVFFTIGLLLTACTSLIYDEGQHGSIMPGEVLTEDFQGETDIDGEKGAVGERGERGEKGDPGERGEQGEQGNPGRGIIKTEVINGYLWITYSDNLENPINVGRVTSETEKIEHFFTNWLILKEATCTETGISLRYCTECHYVEMDEQATLDHIPNDNRICTESQYCEACLGVLAPARGHDEVVHPAQTPTCTEIGWNAYMTCTRCDYSTYEEIAVMNHEYIGGVCTRCGEKRESLGLAFSSNGDGTCFVSGIGTCTDTDIVIPQKSPEGDIVTGIGVRGFDSCIMVTSIDIPDSVTDIGSYAFSYCSELTSVRIPDSVTSIHEGVFLGCYSLTTMVIPNGVANIDYEAFEGCTGLTSIDIPNSVTSIGTEAFKGCSGLMSIVVPDSVTSIGSWVFDGCYSLESISLPFIGESANKSNCLGYFFGASGAVSNEFHVPKSLKCVNITGGQIIAYRAFYNCDYLTSICIPKSIEIINDSAFMSCDALTTVYYTGTETEWKGISIGANNQHLLNATIHYNYVPEV